MNPAFTPDRQPKPQRAPSAERRLERETEAAKALLEALRPELAEGDEALRLDSLEGETHFFEAIDQVLVEIDQTESYANGLRQREGVYKARRERFEARLERLRAGLEQALEIAELKTLRRPAATLTLTEQRPRLVIEDESAIPPGFFERGKPVLDKKRLRAALQDEEIAGARLSQGGVTLTLSRR